MILGFATDALILGTDDTPSSSESHDTTRPRSLSQVNRALATQQIKQYVNAAILKKKVCHMMCDGGMSCHVMSCYHWPGDVACLVITWLCHVMLCVWICRRECDGV